MVKNSRFWHNRQISANLCILPNFLYRANSVAGSSPSLRKVRKLRRRCSSTASDINKEELLHNKQRLITEMLMKKAVKLEKEEITSKERDQEHSGDDNCNPTA